MEGELMPGPVSESSVGPGDESPYVASWEYPNGPKMCPCGHHEGYHDDGGRCLLAHKCLCGGLPPEYFTPDDEMV